ncbi:hypothetical protein OHO83_09220 [Streptomyces sp. NBC_00569]|uniref:hypothetical protein n=1 Tax=Streptomyces sp. NBC_00569 TaxID=2975780 RepID=UPI002E821A57|nr:hypothetical protein [Streptomyces sp. NBC_00569]WUB92477.1 hypothetical protein OHO83_09220 [Streptomyces sp. NBC_00569]
MLSIGNLLLRWASELGGGKVSDLRAGVLRTARSRGIPVREGADGRWLRDVSALGHLDVDWRRGLWSAAPAVLTRVPFSDGFAVITGRRTAVFDGLVEAAGDDWAAFVWAENEAAEGDIPVPDTLYLQYDSAEGLPREAERLGCRYVPCAATQIVSLLPELSAGPQAAPPGGGNAHTVERYRPQSGEYAPAESYDEDGLYRWRSADWVRLVQVRRGREFLSTEHEYGVYLEHERVGTSVMRWKAEGGSGRQRIGRLAVDWGAPLPPLHARAAVLCTGLQPRFHKLARTVCYDNVPLTAGERLARSLHQKLEIQKPAAGPGKASDD